MDIRLAEAGDAEDIWNIFSQVVSKGDSYTFAPDMERKEALSYWMGEDKHCYVAVEDAQIVGTYIIKDNQPGLGSHVANASFMVAPDAQGRSIGRAMGVHALDEARRLGYKAMQFNIVVSTNTSAVKLWEKLGFKIIGTIPEAFQHKELGGCVDAYVMYRKL
ncbi:MAG: GNAT family N-acetyltransferase [Rhodospirillales bacterium]|nr:GNAT family N-acetyltransferase [Rhodospirillales bacterium]